MKASETTLRVLLEGMKQFAIPLFQRPYSWDQEDWYTLWQDILETHDAGLGTGLFLGSIVTKSLPSSPEGVSSYVVIDGQQRLTTLTILLAALRDVGEAQRPDLAAKIQQLYLQNQFAAGLDQYKVLPTQPDRAAYFEIIDRHPKPDLSSQLWRAYNYFHQALRRPGLDQAALEPPRLERVILGEIELVSITLSDVDNEYRIFESLNATGTPLTQADLLRNYFFMRIPVAQQEKVYEELWLPLQATLGTSLENFFRYEIMSEGQFVREADVYQEWKKRLGKIHDPDELVERLRTLTRDGRFYKRLIDPAEEPELALSRSLHRLNRWEAQTVYPFLLHIYKQYDQGAISAEGFVEILGMIESFLVRRLFADIPTNTLNRLFIRLGQQTPEGLDLVNGTRAALSDPGRRWPSDHAFRAAILTYPLYLDSRPEQRRLIIETLEEQMEGKERVDLGGLTIEHVMPQTLTPEWVEELTEDVEDVDEVHARLLHVLGNLTLTGYNPELSNYPFREKRILLEQSSLAMNKEIARESRWSAQQIGERGDRLATLALNIWPGPLEAAATAEATGSARELDMQATGWAQRLYIKYWTGFAEYLERTGSFLPTPVPEPNQCIAFAGVPGVFQVLACVSARDKWVSAAAELEGKAARTLFPTLHSNRGVIERELGESLRWHEDRGLIDVSMEHANPNDRDHWEEQYEWLRQRLELFLVLFSDIVTGVAAEPSSAH